MRLQYILDYNIHVSHSCFRSHSPTKVRHCVCKESVNCCCKAAAMKKQTNPWCGKHVYIFYIISNNSFF